MELFNQFQGHEIEDWAYQVAEICSTHQLGNCAYCQPRWNSVYEACHELAKIKHNGGNNQ